MSGRPLNELLDERIAKNEPFTVLECIQLMAPVLRGLHAAHRHNPSIVHRDLVSLWINGWADALRLVSFERQSQEDSVISPKLTSCVRLDVSLCVSVAKKPDNIFCREQDKSHPPGQQTLILDYGIAWHDEIAHETLACGTRMFSSPEQTRKNSKLDGRSGQSDAMVGAHSTSVKHLCLAALHSY